MENWALDTSVIVKWFLPENDNEVAEFYLEQLTPIGQKWLTQLREEAEQLMLRKAHAYAILGNR